MRDARILTACALLAMLAGGAAPLRAQQKDSAVVAQGAQIFHGKGGALCTTCHGKDAKGLPGLGPDLTDSTWLHGDGSLPFLRSLIKSGVAKGKKSAAVMPPYGGVPLSEAQLDAVAAYVQSLGRKKPGG